MNPNAKVPERKNPKGKNKVLTQGKKFLKAKSPLGKESQWQKVPMAKSSNGTKVPMVKSSENKKSEQ